MSLRRSSRLAATSVKLEETLVWNAIPVPANLGSPQKRPIPHSTPQVSEERTTDRRQDDDVDEEAEEVPKKKRARKKAADVFKLEEFPMRGIGRWKVGPHVSAAGGVENTIVNAASIGATAFALFVKSQRKWASKELTPESVFAFKSRLVEFGYSPEHILPHGSYLVNLGNPDKDKREKSYHCFLDDLQRCEQLGLRLYNFHPGSSLGQVMPEASCAFIAECVNRAHEVTQNIVIVLESMSGAGNIIGSTFEQLRLIIDGVERKDRVGVCLDTCHMFAAGYDIRTHDGWHATMDEFDRIVGHRYLRGMHLNDSKSALGSKKDRHENLGLGELSLSSFSHILTDPRTQDIPLILETPAFDGPGSGLAEGMEVWAKEVEVLKRMSRTADDVVNETIDQARVTPLEEWAEEIRDVVQKMRAKKETKEKARRQKRRKLMSPQVLERGRPALIA